MANYSKQREAILLYLRSVKCHPSAKTVFENVKKQIPNISLGTVYRNLSSLAESGEILQFSVGDGTDRFDGDNSFHLHLFCTECGNVFDSQIISEEIEASIIKSGFLPSTQICVVKGKCKNCRKA